MSLTPAQLEYASKAACRNLDLDPMQEVAYTDEHGISTALHGPRWHHMLYEVRRAHAIDIAITEAIMEAWNQP